jgi:hypothetical protein
MGMLAAMLSGVTNAGVVDEWRFRVLLDGREIGSHRYTLSEEDGQRRLHSEADFEVRWLFVTLYRYRHQAQEVWRGDCLASVNAQTDANGELLEVRGRVDADAFVVDSPRGQDLLPPCVMTFAYWNPGFLGEEALLNPQNGEYLAVDIDGPAIEDLQLNGQSVDARRFRLGAKDLDITVWYSPQGEWLALESPAKGGRTLRYERIWGPLS